MKRIISAMLLLAWLPMVAAEHQSAFSDFPQSAQPQQVGSRLIEKFLVTPHTRFGDPRQMPPPKYVTYPDVCMWLGSLWFAKATDNKQMSARLVERFQPLFGEQKSFIPNPTNVDASVFGALPLEIYIQRLGDERYMKMGLYSADKQWEVPVDVKPEQAGYAKNGYSWQTRIWIDDMFMITTLQTQAYRATGDRRYIDRAAREMVFYLDQIQRPNGLFYHAPHAPFFWARGNGWMAAGMAELLSNLPTDNPHRERIMEGYKKMMASLKEHQAADGMWRQLVDDDESWNETSGTAMFTYGMIVGVKRGWLSESEYGPVARKAWIKLVSYIDSEDELTEVCIGTNAKDFRQHYIDRPRAKGDLHGHAPIVWCAFELLTKPEVVKSRRTTSQGDVNAKLDYTPGKEPRFWSTAIADNIMARYPDYRTAYWKDYTYVQGYMFDAMDRLSQATGDERYMAYMRRYIDMFIDAEGNYLGGALTNLDNFMTGSAYCTMFKRTGDERYKRAALQILAKVEEYPQSDGQFWHGNTRPNMWIDGVFMMQMFLVRCGQYVGQAEYCYDVAARNILAAAKHLQRPDGLLLHAWTTEPERAVWANAAGLSPEVWSEGMGWYTLVVPELLSVMPKSHKDYPAIEQIYKSMMQGLKNTQDPKSGGWYMVVDKADEPLNFIDPSGSAMFTYAIQRGINLGLLNKRSFANVAKRGFESIKPFLKINERGLVDMTGACDGVTIKRDYHGYVTVPKVLNAKEAVAGALWAAVIMEH